MQGDYRQIRGFAEYGFPESHVVGFALLAYASSWMKFREPAAFLATSLNSQSMGFYSPLQLVQDAVRHGIVVRGIDISVSDWDARLEASGGHQPAVRLGFKLIRGLECEVAWRIEEARAVRPFFRSSRCGCSRAAGHVTTETAGQRQCIVRHQRQPTAGNVERSGECAEQGAVA